MKKNNILDKLKKIQCAKDENRKANAKFVPLTIQLDERMFNLLIENDFQKEKIEDVFSQLIANYFNNDKIHLGLSHVLRMLKGDLTPSLIINDIILYEVYDAGLKGYKQYQISLPEL